MRLSRSSKDMSPSVRGNRCPETKSICTEFDFFKPVELFGTDGVTDAEVDELLPSGTLTICRYAVMAADSVFVRFARVRM